MAIETIGDWLSSLKLGDRVKVGHYKMSEKEFVYTKVKFLQPGKVGIETSCGQKRWFSTITGMELNKPPQAQGMICPPGVLR